MKPRLYVGLILFLFFISFILWGLVLIFVSPDDLGVAGALIFLVTIGVVLFTASFLIFYYIRIHLFRLNPIFRNIHPIFREAGMVALLGILLLILAHLNLLTYILFLIIFTIFALIDTYYIIFYDRRRAKKAE